MFAVTPENLLERLAEVLVEDGVEDGVDTGVGVSEPEEEGFQFPRDGASGTPSVDDVDDEEPEPHATEEGDDDGHPNGRLHLLLIETTMLLLQMQNHRLRGDAPCSRRRFDAATVAASSASLSAVAVAAAPIRLPW